MTTAHDLPVGLGAHGRSHWRRWETLALRLAATVAVIHVVDERLVRLPHGVALKVEWAPVVGLVALTVAVVLAARVVRPVSLALVMAWLGAVFAGDGGTHVARLTAGNGTGADIAGAPALVAGLMLFLLAVVGAFRRAPSTRRGYRRWIDRAATFGLALVVATYLVVPVVAGTVQVHLPRRPLAPPPSGEFLPVTLQATDGVDLQAWYRPSQNGAAVMVLNSARGDHVGSAAHARLLADHGYGVLVYDARGTGGSQGTPNGWGWTWLPDVEAGVDYLAERADVIDDDIGLLGLSTGADVAIQAAAKDERVRVVVADGATAQGLADRLEGWESAVSLWPMYTTAQVLTGSKPTRPLADAIAAVGSRPVLLIAAGSIAQELPLNRRYQAAGGANVDLWTLPEVHHTSGISSVPKEYASRVLGQLDDALLRRDVGVLDRR